MQKWVHTALELPSAARDPTAWLRSVKIIVFRERNQRNHETDNWLLKNMLC